MGTIVHFDETWTGESAGWRSELTGSGSMSVLRTFLVVVDNTGGTVRPSAILDYVLCPQFGDAHPYSPYYICTNCTVSRTGPMTFIVKAKYTAESDSIANLTDPNQPSPLDAPAVITWSTRYEHAEIDQDVNGEPILNTAGDPIRGVKTEIADLTCVIQKNVAVWNPLAIYIFANAVNSNIFLNFAAGLVRCAWLTASPQGTADTFLYYSMSGEFQIRYPYNTTPDKAWYKRIRNEGFRYLELNPFTNKMEPSKIIDEASGQPISSPALLKEDGTLVTDPETETHWIEKEIKRSADLNQIGFGV